MNFHMYNIHLTRCDYTIRWCEFENISSLKSCQRGKRLLEFKQKYSVRNEKEMCRSKAGGEVGHTTYEAA